MERVNKLPLNYSSTGTATDLADGNAASDRELRRLLAVTLIEKVYLAYRDKQMFTLLKHAVCAAEQSWTYDFLRKISPLEADLLRDPSIKARVRLRFAGTEFPPIIVFKIYLVGDGTKYISGKRTIQPASSAATDACQMMGHRRFYDQMIVDACQYEKYKITDAVDVTTLQDYMQYLNNVDETPSYLGGKENYWRQLTLEALPRQSIMYDIVEYLRTKSPSDRLRSELPTMMSRPLTQEVQLQHIRAISRLQTPYDPSLRPLISARRSATPSSQTQRRSVQAKRRASRMRKLYGMESGSGQVLDIVPQEGEGLNIDVTGSALTVSPERVTRANLSWNENFEENNAEPLPDIMPSSGPAKDRDIEDQEAKELFEWTQGLNYDDISGPMLLSQSQSESRILSSRAVHTASGL